MDPLFVITFIVGPLLAIAAGVLGLWAARKMGLMPVQTQYMELMRGLVNAQKQKIDGLEERERELTAKNVELEQRCEALERKLSRQQRVHLKAMTRLRLELHALRDMLTEQQQKELDS